MIVQDQELLKIGQVMTISGVPIRTIRYYEDLGLLKSSSRSEGNFRLFSADVLARLALIKRAQHLGLSLLEIREILDVYDQGQIPCDDIKQKLENKLLEIDHQIEQLLTLKMELKGLISGWRSSPAQQPGTICPMLQEANNDD